MQQQPHLMNLALSSFQWKRPVHPQKSAGAAYPQPVPGSQDAALPSPELDPSRVLVVQVGRQFVWMGRSTDSLPKCIPHVLARPWQSADTETKNHENDAEMSHEAYEQMQHDLYPSQSQASHSNSWHQQAKSWNAQHQPQTVMEHNDPDRIEWTVVEQKEEERGPIVGQQALHLPLEHLPYRLYYPLSMHHHYGSKYTSIQHWKQDVTTIWSWALEHQLQIPSTECSTMHLLLVVEDGCGWMEGLVQALMDVVFQLGFHSAALHQESVCASFGAGWMSGLCVVHVGTETTTIACVEDGFCHANSRFRINYGGDDITRVLYHLLMRQSFPYADCRLSRPSDWELMTRFRQVLWTLDRGQMKSGPSTYTFYARSPYAPTRLYEVKVVDEGIMASLALFYPNMVMEVRRRLLDRLDVDGNLVEEEGHVLFPLTGLDQQKITVFRDWATGCPLFRKRHKELPQSQGKPIYPHAPIQHSGILEVSQQQQVNTATTNSNMNTKTTGEDSKAPAAPEEEDNASSMDVDVIEEEDDDDEEEEEEEANEEDEAEEMEEPPEGDTEEDVWDPARPMPPLDEAIIFSIMATSKSLMHHMTKGKGKGSDTAMEADTVPEKATGTTDAPETKAVLMPVNQEERIKHLFNSILIVGDGLASVPGLAKFLEDRLFTKFQTMSSEYFSLTEQNSTLKLDRVTVLPRPRDMDPRYVIWKGGAVFARLENFRDCWISKQEWEKYGEDLLRERSMFHW